LNVVGGKETGRKEWGEGRARGTKRGERADFMLYCLIKFDDLVFKTWIFT